MPSPTPWAPALGSTWVVPLLTRCLIPLLAVGFGSASAQQKAFAGERFQLSRDAAFATSERAFTTLDTLHMRVTGARIVAVDLDSGLTPAPGARGAQRGSWSLSRPEGTLGGELTRSSDGTFVAAFDLAELPRTSAAWTWRAVLLQDGETLYSPTAEIEVSFLPPRADLVAAPTSGEAPLTVAFEDLSTGSVSSWLWDFGDGTTSTEPSPTHVYTTGGEHAVTLTVSNAAGTSQETKTDLVVVTKREFVIRYGMNASENSWYQRGIAFADAMARASEFCTVVDDVITRELAPLIALGEDPPLLGEGWPHFTALVPGTKAGARLFGSMEGSMPDGRTTPYVLTWEGTGFCHVAGNPVVGEAQRTANRVEVFVDPTVGSGNALLYWVLDSSDPADPVRNVHVWLPGMEAEQPILWPPFVEKLRAMNGGRGPSTWRAMDWCRVNEYGRTGGTAPFVFDLAGRITPPSPSQGTKRGVCPEFTVALCNEVGADLHFNLPHPANGIADQDYAAFVRDTLVRIRDGSAAVPGVNGGRPFAGLRPDLTVTFELSNEIWNPTFAVHGWAKTRASTTGVAWRTQVGAELSRVFALVDEVFSGPAAARTRKFVGGWIANDDFLIEVLAGLDPGVRVDAVGPAGYFKPRADHVDSWLSNSVPGDCPNCPTAEEVVEAARFSIVDLRNKVRAHDTIARSHVNADGSSPELVLYEAGQSFVANFQPWAGAAAQAQRLPSMFDAYVLDFVPMLIEEGVDEVLWYSFVSDNSAHGNGNGPFGVWDRMDQTITLPVLEPYRDEGAPKAAAIYKLPPFRTP